jgi:hypothetical protein
LRRWVGVATNVGDALTFKLVIPCNKFICQSVIRSALRHKRLTPLGGENDASHADDKIFVCSKKSSSNEPRLSCLMPTIDPKDLIGRTFLKETGADGQRLRAPIVRAIMEKDAELKRDPDHIKFLCKLVGHTTDDIYTFY